MMAIVGKGCEGVDVPRHKQVVLSGNGGRKVPPGNKPKNNPPPRHKPGHRRQKK